MDLANLQAHMETFYLCSHLPIRAFNKEGIEILGTGFSHSFSPLTESLNSWLKEAYTALPDKTIFTFMPKQSVYFTVCPVTAQSPEDGLYLIGPYTNSLELQDSFLFKPDHCMPHLISLLYTLAGHHSSSNSAETSSSSSQMANEPASVSEDYSYHVSKAEQYIRTHYAEPITLDALAKHLGLNKSYFCTIFKKVTKDSFCNYTNKVRVEESKLLLRNTNDSMLDIALAAGFSSASYFNTIFKKLEGKTPLEYRKGV